VILRMEDVLSRLREMEGSFWFGGR
jgi:hypothetical protein